MAAPPVHVAAILECRATLQPLQVTCADPAGGVGDPREAIIGGQNVYIKLTSSNLVTYGDSILEADLTVKNLIQQPMGTTDGATPAATGVRVQTSDGWSDVLGGEVIEQGFHFIKVLIESIHVFFKARSRETKLLASRVPRIQCIVR